MRRWWTAVLILAVAASTARADVYDDLLEEVRSGDVDRQTVALTAIIKAGRGGPRVGLVLVEACKAKSSVIRAMAVSAYGALEIPETDRVMTTMWEDPSQYVRGAVLRGWRAHFLREQKIGELTPWLVKGLEDRKSVV